MPPRTDPEAGSGYLWALRRYLKECAGKAFRIRPVSRADFEALAAALNLPTRDVQIRRDAVQGVLTTLLQRSREGRTEEIRELLEMGDRDLLAAFTRLVRFRLIDEHPARDELQALRQHVRAALADPEDLPRAVGLPTSIRRRDRFSGPLVAQAIAALLEEIRSEDPGLLWKGWEDDPARRTTVARKVMSGLREKYLSNQTAPPEPDWVSWRVAKRSAMAPRTAHRLLAEVARRHGPRKASVLILWEGGGGYPEIEKRLGVGRTSADRALADATKVLQGFVMREKGRLRHRGIDVIDADRVDPADSEWGPILAEIGKVANAPGPLRHSDRETLRRLVNRILAEVC